MMAPAPIYPELREDQYEVEGNIGSGSFGQVYLVTHKRERKQYVMKTIESPGATLEGHEATAMEVRMLSAVRHPNVVGYRESFVNSQGHLCILMEYCEHGDVYTYLQAAKQSRCVPEENRLIEWFIQVALALQALHRKKILHRDLKTQNIFLTGNRAECVFALKLGDFGIAKALSSTTDLARTQIGTPFYMSPELINNKPYSYKSDIWGLGCVLYEIINGQRAFDAQSLNGLALKIIKGHYTPISVSCSLGTKSLIKSMLSKRPQHRPTLKEILHLPSIRSRIHAVQRNVVAACEQEARQSTEQALFDQLAGMGLGALVNCPGAGPQKDRRRLMRRLECAERRKSQEEQKLHETAKLLQQSLAEAQRPSGPSMAPVVPPLPAAGGLGNLAPLPASAMHEAPAVPNLAARAAGGGVPLGAVWPPPPAGEGDTEEPRMTHRDRVLWEKERRKEEAQQRFEEEARKIREENLAHQRAWAGDRERHQGPGQVTKSFLAGGSFMEDQTPGASPRDSTGSTFNPPGTNYVPRPLPPAESRRRARVHPDPGQCASGTGSDAPGLGAGNAQEGSASEQELPSHLNPVSWLLEYDHVQPANLSRPFESCRPKVVHSPRKGTRNRTEPSPPPRHYGEPTPPHNALPPPGGGNSYGLRASAAEHGQPRARGPPLHSARLERLAGPRTTGGDFSAEHTRSSWPDYQDAYTDTSAASSGSLSEVDEDGDGVSEIGGAALDAVAEETILQTQTLARPPEQRGLRPQALQHRLDHCEAAIYKHQLTIEMLKYSAEEERDTAGLADAAAVERTALAPAAASTFTSLPEGGLTAGFLPGSTEDAVNTSWQALAVQPLPGLGTSRRCTAAPAVVQDLAAKLMRRCVEGLGSEKFQAARRCLQTRLDSSELPGSTRQQMLDLLGADKIGFLSLLDQLVHMERRWGSQDHF